MSAQHRMQLVGHWSLRGYGMWAAEEQTSETTIQEALAHLKRYVATPKR